MGFSAHIRLKVVPSMLWLASVFPGLAFNIWRFEKKMLGLISRLVVGLAGINLLWRDWIIHLLLYALIDIPETILRSFGLSGHDHKDYFLFSLWMRICWVYCNFPRILHRRNLLRNIIIFKANKLVFLVNFDLKFARRLIVRARPWA